MAAPAVSAGHQAALGRGHRHVQAVVVHVEGPHRHRHVPNHVLTAGAHHLEKYLLSLGNNMVQNFLVK